MSQRIILDNGAWSAFVQGAPMAPDEQLEGLLTALERLPTVEWIVAPDVVADAAKTCARIDAAAPHLKPHGLHNLLLPVQEGMDFGWVIERAERWGCGVFVGGATWKFKVRATRAMERAKVRWIHVGRASKRAQLQAAAEAGADAVDSSSFLRVQHHNVAMRSSYSHTLHELPHHRGSPIHTAHTPS